MDVDSLTRLNGKTLLIVNGRKYYNIALDNHSKIICLGLNEKNDLVILDNKGFQKTSVNLNVEIYILQQMENGEQIGETIMRKVVNGVLIENQNN